MIQAIYVAKKPKAPQIQIEAVQVDFGKGIVGDRNYGKKGDDGPNITFVESEAIAAFNMNFEQNIALSDTRRNIVTQGVRLNDLVGKTFSIGSVTFYGVELCLPCAKLGKALENDGITSAQVVKAWLHSGGLRANVLNTGVLRVGMEFS
ncbi:sulfurase [Marinomonas sp. C2222]|uniref:Sulfurase n=1 Tax=Marinomonas sargassi TaxID=2984494 RepID=A0ABT2YTW0_9GAMM|nr:MOSC domain-containing protein [Marinomonas sargassi]MCV2403336.1 sulfurase [Marinomonas sargassi]